MENLNYNLIFYGLFFAILALGILFGYMRGFKKSIYSFIVMLIFYAIFFLTVDLVVSKLWYMSMPGLGSLLGQFSPELSNSTSLNQALPIILNQMLGDSLGPTLSNEEFLAFITSVSLLIVKIIYAFIYFTVVYLIYKFIFFIIRIIFLRTNKDDNVPKRRGLGALFGLLHGGLTLFFLLIILGGTMSISGNTLKLLPSNFKVAELDKVVSAYKSNLIVDTVELVGVKDASSNQVIPLNEYLFDTVFSFHYHDKKVSLRKEIGIAADIKGIYDQSDFNTTKNYSDITGDEVTAVFDKLSGSDLFTSVLPLGIEVAADYLDTDVTIPKEELYAIDWNTEVLQLGEVSVVAFNIINTAGIDNSDTDLETVTVNGDDVRDLFNSLSESKLVTLSAYVALEPLLEKAGSQTHNIITVPEGLVWEDEFKAIGLVAGAIVDTGVTIGDLESGDPALMISSLSDLDFTVILNSKIVSNALINIFSGAADVEGFNVFVVPQDIVWNDVLDDQGNITQSGELRNILNAVNEISQTADNFDFANLNIDIISEFTDDAIDAIFNSRVLVATVSTLITDMDLGNTPLVIPDSVFDTDHYIKKSELTALVSSARMVVTTLTCDEGDACQDTGFDVAKAFNLSDTDITTLLSSQIISSTIGNLIIDQGGTILTIPTSALTTIYIDTTPKNIVSNAEIKKLFKAVYALGITDLTNMTFDATIIKNLATVDDATVLDQTKADNIFNSDIIHATLSKMLLDLGSGASSVLDIPYKDINNVVIRYTDDTDYITTDELTAILKAVLVLNINDFAEVETLDVTNITNHIDVLLDSAIFHATISDQLLKLGPNIIKIPNEDEAGNAVKMLVGDTDQQTEFVTKNEIHAIVDSLKLLGITDISSFAGAFTLNNISTDVDQNTLLASASIHATISQKLLELDDQVLIVPLYKQDNVTKIQKTVDGTDFIEKTEIKSIINAFLAMDFGDLSSFGGTIDSSKFFAERDTILLSSSIQATLSSKILNDTGGQIIVPDSVRILESDVTYVDVDEIKAMMGALDELNLTDFTQIDINPSNVFTVDFDVLLESASIQATISDLILDHALDDTAAPGSDTLIVPLYFRENIQVDDVPKAQIKYPELHAILTSLQTLNVSNFEGAMNPTLITSMNDSELNTMLASGSIHVTIDNMLKGNNTINTKIPDLARDDYYDMTGITKVQEIIAFIKASDVFVSDFTNVTFNMSAVVNLSPAERGIVLDSMIVRNSITPEIEVTINTYGGYSIEATDYENNDVTTFFTKASILAMFDHINV